MIKKESDLKKLTDLFTSPQGLIRINGNRGILMSTNENSATIIVEEGGELFKDKYQISDSYKKLFPTQREHLTEDHPQYNCSKSLYEQTWNLKLNYKFD